MGEYKGIMGGVDSMMAAKFTPWHFSYNQDRVRLTDLDITSGRQAMTMAGIDWSVLKVSLAEFMPDHAGAEDHVVLLRNDIQAVLGIAKPGYGVIDNTVPADLSDAVIEAVPGATIESCGSLYTPGKVVWFLVRLPDSKVFGTDGGETHERYVMITTSHDGSSALTIRPTNVRVQCMNTFSMAFGNASMYTIRHTTNALDYVEEARRAIKTTYANADAFDAEVQRLLDTELDSRDFTNFVIPEVVGSRPDDAGRSQTVWDDKFGLIVEAYNADHNEAIRGSAWGAVNALNEYETWAIKPRGRELWEAQFSKLLTNDFPMTKAGFDLFAAV